MSRPNRRRAVRAVAPVAGLLAAGLLVWQGSYAAFTATTVNPGNAWAAGTVSLTDDDGGGATAGTAMFSTAATTPAGATDTKALKPGDIRINCIKVTNNGTLAGPVKLYVAPTTFSQTNALGDNIKVTIEEGTGSGAFGSCAGFTGSAIATSVNLSAIPTVYGSGYGSAGNLAVGASRVYRITTTVDSGAPNSVQGGSAAAAFQWEIQA